MMTNPGCLTVDRSPIIAGIMQYLEGHSHQTARKIAAGTNARLSTVETYMGLLVKRNDVHISKWFLVRHPKGMATWAAGYSKGFGVPAPYPRKTIPRKTIACSDAPVNRVVSPKQARPIPLDPILAALGGFR